VIAGQFPTFVISSFQGFYSNAAICVPNWTNTSQEAVRRLESEEFTVEIGGKREFKRFYGGQSYCNLMINPFPYFRPSIFGLFCGKQT
jgi:hypothetical protein